MSVKKTMEVVLTLVPTHKDHLFAIATRVLKLMETTELA